MKLTNVVAVRLDDDDVLFLKSELRRKSVSKSEFIRMLIHAEKTRRFDYKEDLDRKIKALSGEVL